MVAPRAGTDEAARWQVVAAELEAEIGELRVQLGRAEELAAAREDRIADLRAQLEREITRGDRLDTELRRPWWRRMLG